MKKHLSIAAILALAAVQAKAVILQNVETTGGVYNAYAASGTDLLQLPGTNGTSSGYTAFVGSGYNFGSPATVLRDGSVGLNGTSAADSPNQAFEGSSQNPQYTVTFTLDLTNAANGYDLTSIATITGWSDRARQAYNIYYSTVGSSTFVKLNSGLTPTGGVPDSFGENDTFVNGSMRVTVTDTTGVIASNVDEILFEILPTASNGSVYREIDVMGLASVPEPTSTLLGGLGVLALLRRRRA